MLAQNHLISIVGSTASGKTKLALALAELLSTHKTELNLGEVHLLSADSRQVYQGLENLTGADIPADWQQEHDPKFSYPHFKNQKQNSFFHGLSIISPSIDWSVAHFFKLYQEIKDKLSSRDLLIVIGGTGFYQKQLFAEAETLTVPPNYDLRNDLVGQTVNQLQEKLAELDPEKLAGFNNSDLNNPRRLIRAIEVAKYKNENQIKLVADPKIKPWLFYLDGQKEARKEKIKQRIKSRFSAAKKEVELLLKKKLNSQQLASSSIGLLELAELIQGKISEKDCFERWQQRENSYANEQDTWWQKYAKGQSLTAENPDSALEIAYKKIRSVL